MDRPRLLLLSLAAVLAVAFAAGEARAHCDSLDGPVVRDARLALERGDPTPVLKWVTPKGEAEVREAFRSTLAVRAKGGEARQLADRYFFRNAGAGASCWRRRRIHGTETCGIDRSGPRRRGSRT